MWAPLPEDWVQVVLGRALRATLTVMLLNLGQEELLMVLKSTGLLFYRNRLSEHWMELRGIHSEEDFPNQTGVKGLEKRITIRFHISKINTWLFPTVQVLTKMVHPAVSPSKSTGKIPQSLLYRIMNVCITDCSWLFNPVIDNCSPCGSVVGFSLSV